MGGCLGTFDQRPGRRPGFDLGRRGLMRVGGGAGVSLALPCTGRSLQRHGNNPPPLERTLLAFDSSGRVRPYTFGLATRCNWASKRASLAC